MKTAFLINSLGMGGAERVALTLARYFFKKNHDILFVTSRAAEREYETDFPIKRRYLEEEVSGSRISGFGAPGRIALRPFVLMQIWREEAPDVIISFIGKMNMYACMSVMMLKVRGGRLPKLYLSVRSDPKEEYPGRELELAKHLFRSADGVIFQTRQQAKSFGGSIMKRGAVLPNALNESFLEPLYEGERDGRIVMVGRLDGNKNHKMVIEALSEIIDEDKDFDLPVLEIYGDALPGDETPERLKELVDTKGLQMKVRFMGRRDDIRLCIEKASVFVLASGFEGMPNALLEAMACGLAVISTDCPCGGPAQVIKNEENGILIPVGDKEALKTALVRLAGDKELRKRLGQNASKIRNKLSTENVCRLWEKYITGDF